MPRVQSLLWGRASALPGSAALKGCATRPKTRDQRPETEDARPKTRDLLPRLPEQPQIVLSQDPVDLRLGIPARDEPVREPDDLAVVRKPVK